MINDSNDPFRPIENLYLYHCMSSHIDSMSNHESFKDVSKISIMATYENGGKFGIDRFKMKDMNKNKISRIKIFLNLIFNRGII